MVVSVIDDTETGEDAYGLEVRVADVAGVGVVVERVISGSADDTEAEDHDESEHESQRLLESSHDGNSSFSSTPKTEGAEICNHGHGFGYPEPAHERGYQSYTDG